MDSETLRRMHRFMEEGLDMRLGVADKYLVNKFFPDFEENAKLDPGVSTASFLYSMGYRSVKIEGMSHNAYSPSNSTSVKTL